MSFILNEFRKIPLAFGGAAISGEGGGYGFGSIKESDAIDLLNHAYQRGIKVFDTAPVYGFSLAEKRVGKAFKSIREKVFITSKCGVTWSDNRRINLTNDPLVCTKMLEQSLRDLKSDYIDLYMIHWPDKSIDIRRLMEVLSRAKVQGKIKHIGLCNTFVKDLELASEIDKIEVVQSEFNLFTNSIKDSLFPYLLEQEISFMSYGTFDKGILTGRVNKDRIFEKEDCRSWAPWWKKQDLDLKFKKFARLRPLLNELDLEGRDIALGHNLSFEGLVTPICGFRDLLQLESAISSINKLPDQSVIDRALEILKDEQ